MDMNRWEWACFRAISAGKPLTLAKGRRFGMNLQERQEFLDKLLQGYWQQPSYCNDLTYSFQVGKTEYSVTNEPSCIAILAHRIGARPEVTA